MNAITFNRYTIPSVKTTTAKPSSETISSKDKDSFSKPEGPRFSGPGWSSKPEPKPTFTQKLYTSFSAFTQAASNLYHNRSSVESAILNNDMKKLHELTKDNVNISDYKGYSPLHYAIIHNNYPIFSRLLERNADTDRQTKDGLYPIHLAVEPERHDILWDLLHKNPSILNSVTNNDAKETPLTLAVAQGNIGAINILLLEGCNPNRLAAHKTSPLIRAAALNDLPVLQMLLQQNGILVNLKDENGRSALHYAVLTKNLHMVKRLLTDDSIKLDQQDKEFLTPLLTAAQNKDLEIVSLLLSKGANPKLAHGKDHENASTALHYLVQELDTIDEKILQGLKTVINAKNESGQTAAQYAAEHAKYKLLRELLMLGTDPSIKSQAGVNLFNLALDPEKGDSILKLLKEQKELNKTPPLSNPESMASKALEQGNLDAFNLFLKNGDPNWQDGQKNSLLHSAIQLQNHSAVESLLKHKDIRVNVKNEYDDTPLHLSAKAGQVNTILKLLDKGADPAIKNGKGETILQILIKQAQDIPEKLMLRLAPSEELLNSTDKNGQTALFDATEQGNLDVIKKLLAMGADPSIQNRLGVSPLLLAIENSRNDILNLLLKQEKCNKTPVTVNQLSPVHLAIARDNAEALEQLLYAGSDPNVLDTSRNAPIHHAAQLNKNELLSILLKDPRTKVNLQNKLDYAPLHVTAENGNISGLKRLLHYGADPKLKNIGGESALKILAAHPDIMDIDKDLLQQLAPNESIINSADQKGRTPLHEAAEYKKPGFVSKLLEKKANPNAKAKNDATPLHIAACLNDENNRASDEILRQLVDAKGDLAARVYGGAKYEKNPDVRHLLCERDRDNLVESLVNQAIDNGDKPARFWDTTMLILEKYAGLRRVIEIETIKTQEELKRQQAEIDAKAKIREAEEEKEKRIIDYRIQSETSAKRDWDTQARGINFNEHINNLASNATTSASTRKHIL